MIQCCSGLSRFIRMTSAKSWLRNEARIMLRLALCRVIASLRVAHQEVRAYRPNRGNHLTSALKREHDLTGRTMRR